MARHKRLVTGRRLAADPSTIAGRNPTAPRNPRLVHRRAQGLKAICSGLARARENGHGEIAAQGWLRRDSGMWTFPCTMVDDTEEAAEPVRYTNRSVGD